MTNKTVLKEKFSSATGGIVNTRTITSLLVVMTIIGMALTPNMINEENIEEIGVTGFSDHDDHDNGHGSGHCHGHG